MKTNTPPPPWRGALAPAFLALLAALISGNAAAQTCGENQIPDPANNAPCICMVPYTDADPTDQVDCQCLGPSVTEENGECAYKMEELSDCGDNQIFRQLPNGIASFCVNCAVTARPNEDRSECIEAELAVGAEHHSACYAANWETPIANSETAEDCRAAQDTPEDNLACTEITGVPIRFVGVLDGTCAGGGGCRSENPRATPEVLDFSFEQALVGTCLPSVASCLNRDGFVNDENECRLPRSDDDCMRHDENTPVYHAVSETCLAACEMGQAYNDGGVCDCDTDNMYENLAESGEQLNCQLRCAGNEIRNTDLACEACGMNQVANDEGTACACAERHDNLGTAEELNCHPACDSGQTRDEGETTCRALMPSDCPDTQFLMDGACMDCGANQVRSTENECECAATHPNTPPEADPLNCQLPPECSPTQILMNGACMDCGANQVRSTENECECAAMHTNTPPEADPLNCQPLAECSSTQMRAANGIDCRDTEAGDCSSTQIFMAGMCADCGQNQVSNEGRTECSCAATHPNIAASGEPLDCRTPCGQSEERLTNGMCVEACVPGTTERVGETCEPVCEEGEMRNPEDGMCVMRAASGGGGSSGGGGGGAAALIAVPIVLIGGYWLLGGFDYIDPAYDFSYSGENGNLDWHGNAGFNLRHGDLRSYASAVQSNGDAVSYESGISYERDFLSLTYDAAESESEYLYDLGARMKAEIGLWTIAPAATAEFQYQLEEDEWSSETAAGLMAAWTAHRWKLRAQSAFAGDGGHALDVELRF